MRRGEEQQRYRSINSPAVVSNPLHGDVKAVLYIYIHIYICMCADIYKSNHSLPVVCAVIHQQQWVLAGT